MEIKPRKIVSASLLLLGISLISFTNLSDDVKGWFLAGSNPENYKIGIEKSTERNGKVGYLKSVETKNPKNGFGTIMQQFAPKDYLGEKVKLTGYIKSENVKDWAGMWMRVDGDSQKNRSLSFDNMQDRPIKGSLDWKKYEIILDVPQESGLIAYGVLLSGPGSIWLDNFNFEILDEDAATTGTGSAFQLERPTNTDFEENN